MFVKLYFNLKKIILGYFNSLYFSVNVLSNRTAQDRYLQYLSKRNDSFMHQRNGDIDNDSDKKEQNSSNEWNEWMRNQPISVLRLDRTERLVLKIGG